MSRSALRSMKNGLEEEEEEEEEEEDLDDEADAAHLRFVKDRRRARSLPALLVGAPGTTGRKRVQFADSLGLDLASVKHFSSLEDPQIPSKVLSRHGSFPDPPRLVACFPEPRDVERRVRRLGVCLEGVCVSRLDLRGHIRVLAGCADKEVGLRYSFNDWRSHEDARAVRAAAAPPAAVGERFRFSVHTPAFMDPGSAVHFAVYVRSEEGEFWDNCEGRNYTLQYRRRPGPGLGLGPGPGPGLYGT